MALALALVLVLVLAAIGCGIGQPPAYGAEAGGAAEPEFVWPTPNRAYAEGKPYGDFVQPTESGRVESGLFGCVRTDRRQFHEGIDLFPVRRDRRGEPADPVFAVMPGVVRHVNATAGASSYGRYVVIEHTATRPHVISLYAHLLSVAADLRAGMRVEAGQTIGVMGRSAAGYSIPRERAHVHVELGLWLSREFQRWYDAQDFGSRNEHGVFNGMNIVGFDLLDFVERRRDGQVEGTFDYIARQPTAVTVILRNARTPDFVQRYPELRRANLPEAAIAGWRIEFTWFGLPKAWWPLDAPALAGVANGARLEIAFHDSALLERFPCQGVVRVRNGAVLPGPKLLDAIDILFAGP